MRRKSKNLIRKAWKEYKAWANKVYKIKIDRKTKEKEVVRNSDRFLKGAKAKSYEEFRRAWKDAEAKTWVGKMQQMKSSMLYQTDDKTARHIQELVKKLKGPDTELSIREIRTMHTHKIADDYFGTKEMKDYYQEQLEKGLTKTEAKKAVSEYYYGS